MGNPRPFSLFFLEKKEETEKERTISFNYGKKERVKKKVFATFSDNTDSGNSLLSSSQLLNPASFLFFYFVRRITTSCFPLAIQCTYSYSPKGPFFHVFQKKKRRNQFSPVRNRSGFIFKEIVLFPGYILHTDHLKAMPKLFCGKAPPFSMF